MAPSVLVGLDLGTSKAACVAWDPERDEIVAAASLPNGPPLAAPSGRSEWDAVRLVGVVASCTRKVTDQLAGRARVAGVGVSTQQHGIVLVDEAVRPMGPFVGWQDRRGIEIVRNGRSLLAEARARTGDGLRGRTGCSLQAGHAAVTLFALAAEGALPAKATACAIGELVVATLTGDRPVTERTVAAATGMFDVTCDGWDEAALTALGLSPTLFPSLVSAKTRAGRVSAAAAAETGFPVGTPVAPAVGDCQAAFVGAATDPSRDVVVNVGTGAQVVAPTAQLAWDEVIETRPLPGEGFALVRALASGGDAFAAWERLFRTVLAQLADVAGPPIFERLHALAEAVPPGADGLRYLLPAHPGGGATWTGVTAATLTPGHFVRACFEGLADELVAAHASIARLAPVRGALVAAGNAIHRNPLLVRALADRLGPVRVAPHAEEAALGAAKLAAAIA